MGEKIKILEVEDECQIKIVEEMANKIWHEHYEPIIGKAQVDYMLSKFQSAEAIRNQLESGYRYFLMLLDGEYAGYFAILPDYSNNKMFLSKLYVDKNFRGRGIARMSISYIESICKETGLESIWLTVNKNNQGSIAAYEKMGFVNLGDIVQDIGNGFIMDDYKMEKGVINIK